MKAIKKKDTDSHSAHFSSRFLPSSQKLQQGKKSPRLRRKALLCTDVTPHLLLCRLARLGQSFPPSQRRPGRGPTAWEKKKPSFHHTAFKSRTALVRSHHVIPNPTEIFHMGLVWLRAFMSCPPPHHHLPPPQHLLIAKNGNGL